MTSMHGRPVWFELNAKDQASAAAFYEAVLGWTTRVSGLAEHGGYAIASAVDGEGVAGIMGPPPPGAPSVPGWSLHFGTDDIAATLARVEPLGGTVLFGPMAIPHVGRFALVRDPHDVTFFVMQPDAPDPARPFKQAPDAQGHAVWIELATPDPDGAFAFYGGLFGWTHCGGMPMGDMGEYAFFDVGDLRPGAIMPSLTTGAPARWNVYFLVPDIDAALAVSQTHGGQTIHGPSPIPGGDYSAHIVDCHGDQVGLVGPRRAEVA